MELLFFMFYILSLLDYCCWFLTASKVNENLFSFMVLSREKQSQRSLLQLVVMCQKCVERYSVAWRCAT